eukprot:9063_1
MSNSSSDKPAPLPPPQQQQQQQQSQQYYGAYPYNNPYYYAYYNAARTQQQSSTPQLAPHPPPPPPGQTASNSTTKATASQASAYYSYYNNRQYNPPPPPPPPPLPLSSSNGNTKSNLSFTWNRTTNNPPPPPPKPLISPKRSNNKQSNAASALFSHFGPQTKSYQQMDKKHAHPPALTKYFEKCLQRLKQMSPELATPQNRNKLQKQLKMRLKQARETDTVFTIDWNHEPLPPLLRHLISISPKKRKAHSEWNGHSMKIRKVAKTSMSHREVHQKDHQISRFLEESPPPRFVSVKSKKSESDMSCSGDSSVSDDTEEYEEEAYVLSKGRGFTTRKVTKRRKKHKKKKSKHSGFRWDSMDVDELDTTQHTTISHKHKGETMAEITRILERKRRFESQQSGGDKHNTHSTKQAQRMKQLQRKVSMNGSSLSRDMQQLMDWHEKRVIGTCTKIEKDYFRLTSEPNPSEVRTLETMKKTFNLLMIRWKTKNKRDYLYVGGQFKSLRQDLRVQHIRNQFSVQVYEENAKICLEVGDLSEYNQCQGQLKELYREQEVLNANYIEFLGYRLLYEAVTKNFYGVSCIMKIEKRYCKEEEIVNTLNIIQAIQRMDYNTFFKVYKKLRHHARCILDQIVYKVRYQALCRISVSYCPSMYPIKQLAKTIGFGSQRECVEYLRNTGCVLHGAKKKNAQLMLNCKASRGKIKEFVPKSEDDELGVTHGSVYHDKNQDENSIAKFMRKK